MAPNLIPFDDRDGFIWFNGELVDWRDAKVHLLSHGLHYGSCVFEGERCYNGRIFKSREHSERLLKSGDILDFKIPYTVDQLEEAKHQVLEANGITEGYLRPVAWRGSEMMAVSSQHARIHVAVAAWPWPTLFGEELARTGISMTLAPYRRPPSECAPVHSKAAGLYMICTLSKHAAESQGFHDALMLDSAGNVAEATGANIFFVMDGALHTPTPHCFLDGITRRTVISLAQDQGLEVVERTITLPEIANAQEAFLTGTAAEVTPIGRIDKVQYQVGQITTGLRTAYMDLVRGNTPDTANRSAAE